MRQQQQRGGAQAIGWWRSAAHKKGKCFCLNNLLAQEKIGKHNLFLFLFYIYLLKQNESASNHAFFLDGQGGERDSQGAE